MKEVLHLLQLMRIIPIAVLIFIIWLTYDFHVFYKQNALKFDEFQVAAIFAYAGTLVGVIKYLFEHISKKIEKDEY